MNRGIQVTTQLKIQAFIIMSILEVETNNAIVVRSDVKSMSEERNVVVPVT